MIGSITRLCFLLVTLLLSSNAIYMDLYPGDMRCLAQELDQLELAVFAFGASSAIKDTQQKLTIKITDPEGEDIHFDKVPITGKRVEHEQSVQKRGLYELCFELHNGKTPVRTFVHVDYKPLDENGKELGRQINRDDVPRLQKELADIDMRIKEIIMSIEHAKRQEAYLNIAGDITSSRLQWFSFLSIVVLLGMSIWQIIYLRRFFTAKKLL